MTPAIMGGILRRRKIRIGEAADRDAAGLATFLRMEQVGPADRAEAELRPLIAGADMPAGLASHLLGMGEAGDSRKDAADPMQADRAMTDAYTTRFALNLNVQLSAGAGRRAA